MIELSKNKLTDREDAEGGLSGSLLKIINQKLQILLIVDKTLGIFPTCRLWLTTKCKCLELDLFCKEILSKVRKFGSRSETVCAQPQNNSW